MAKTKYRNDELILSALLSTNTVRQAAEKCGLTTKTIYKRLQEPEFKARYDKARRELFETSAAALQSYLEPAIAAMGAIVSDDEANDQTKLNAAEAIIRNTLKMTERTDVLDRLDELEKKVE